MSIHLLECAGQRTDLQATQKLALMAFADSADRYTGIAFPGLEQVMRWAGVERSRAAEIVAQLVEMQLLRKHRGGHRGRRAEFVVFPLGCCSEHPRDLDVRDRAEETEITAIGSAGPDSLSAIGSAGPDPIHPAYAKASSGADPITEKGSGKGPVGRTPSLTPNTYPPFPPASPGGDQTSGCQKPGPVPHPNCRGCGTTNRQIGEQRDRELAAERRRQAEADAEAAKAKTARTRCATEDRPPEVVQLVSHARDVVAQARVASRRRA